MAPLYLMHARTCELEQSKAELRARAGRDLPLPTLRANGKMVGPAVKREGVAHLWATMGLSERGVLDRQR